VIDRRSGGSRSHAGPALRRCLRFLRDRAARGLSRGRSSPGESRFLSYRDEAEATDHLLSALRHPLRRELLRRYVEATGPLNPRDLAHLLGEPLSIVSHHVRELESDLAIILVKDGEPPGCAADLHEASWWVRLSPEIAAPTRSDRASPRLGAPAYREEAGRARDRHRPERRPRPRTDSPWRAAPRRRGMGQP